MHLLLALDSVAKNNLAVSVVQFRKMQSLLFIGEVLSNLDADVELTTFLCSFIVFFILKSMRSRYVANNAKITKLTSFVAEDEPDFLDDEQYGQVEKAFENAFEEEDSWQALKQWSQLKHYEKSSIHLPMMIRAMRSCNKGPYFISTEIKIFLKAHPQIANIGLINDLLEPIARRPDEAQLADLIARMIPSIKLTKDPRTYEILLTMHVANRNHEKAQEVMVEMKSQQISFTPCATVAVLTIGLQTRNFDLVLKAFAKLKASWDIRSTWAVSLFSLESHKTNTLKEIVELAHEAQKMGDLLPAMIGMTLPEEVLALIRAKLSLLSDVDIATMFALLQKTCSSVTDDAIYKTVVDYLKLQEEKALPPWKRQPAPSRAAPDDGRLKMQEEEKTLPPWKRQAAPLQAPSTDGPSLEKKALPPWKRSEVSAAKDSSSLKKKALPPWKRQPSASEVSTSDGSSSGSEEDSTRAYLVTPLTSKAK